MKYVLLIHASEARYATMSKEDGESVMRAYGDFTRDIFTTGRAGDCAALEPVHTATTVQVRDGKKVVKDGPFAETREQLGGYYAFDAKDEAEAIAWAGKIPGATLGTVEVRPVLSFGGEPEEKTEGGPLDREGQKDYLLLLYEREELWTSLSEAEQEATFGRYMTFSEGIKRSGKFVAGEPLESVTKAKSVGAERGGRVVRDGPFAETREQLGGYYRVLARDLDEAIAMATRIPAAETGTIEIRPVRDTSAYT